MASFQMICEAMRDDKAYVDRDALIGHDNSDGSVEKAIRIGLQHSDNIEEGDSFWDKFIKVFQSDAESLSQLLGVPRNKVAHMPYLVRDALEHYRKLYANEKHNKKKKRSEMMQTGDTAANGRMASGQSKQPGPASIAGQFGDRDVAGPGNSA